MFNVPPLVALRHLKLGELGSRRNYTQNIITDENIESVMEILRSNPAGLLPPGRPDQPPEASLALSVEMSARSVDSELQSLNGHYAYYGITGNPQIDSYP